MFAALDQSIRSRSGRAVALMLLRVSTAGLIFWWGLVKALQIGQVGVNVSNKYYGGAFSTDWLLVGFGWLQVVAAVLLAVGLFRAPLLWLQFGINLFVAVVVWQSLIDPFWLWMPGERPDTLNALFYPSAIAAAASWALIALRDQDVYALDARR